jgi:hypothetical protein
MYDYTYIIREIYIYNMYMYYIIPCALPMYSQSRKLIFVSLSKKNLTGQFLFVQKKNRSLCPKKNLA